jgi:hypothetical protein
MYAAVVFRAPQHTTTVIEEAQSQRDFEVAFKQWPHEITLIPSLEQPSPR